MFVFIGIFYISNIQASFFNLFSNISFEITKRYINKQNTDKYLFYILEVGSLVIINHALGIRLQNTQKNEIT